MCAILSTRPKGVRVRWMIFYRYTCTWVLHSASKKAYKDRSLLYFLAIECNEETLGAIFKLYGLIACGICVEYEQK